MNAIFVIVTSLSIIITLFTNPNLLIETFSTSSEKALSLTFTLVSVYACTMAFGEVLTTTKLTDKIAKLLEKPVKKLFCTTNKQVISQISINLSANLLGISGIATPSGINAMKLLDLDGNEHGKTMLAVISSTSIQIIPLSVMQAVISFGGNNLPQVFLVTILSTFVSTLVGILLVLVVR